MGRAARVPAAAALAGRFPGESLGLVPGASRRRRLGPIGTFVYTVRAAMRSHEHARRAHFRLVSLLLVAVLAAGCERRGFDIDPSVVERPLPGPETPVDTALARAGAGVYQARCVACHKLGEGVAVGPDLRGVAEKRDPVWLRGMILNPDSMLRTDSLARALLARYRVPMMDPGIGEPEFRAVLEFLRTQPAQP